MQQSFLRLTNKNQNGFSFHTSLACICVLFLYDRAAMQLQLYSKQAHAHWDPDSPPKQCTTMIIASHPLSLIPAKLPSQEKTQVLHSLRLVVFRLFMRRPPSLWCPRPPFERTNPRPSAAVDNRPRSAKRRSQIHERLKWPLQLHEAQQKFQFLINSVLIRLVTHPDVEWFASKIIYTSCMSSLARPICRSRFQGLFAALASQNGKPVFWTCEKKWVNKQKREKNRKIGVSFYATQNAVVQPWCHPAVRPQSVQDAFGAFDKTGTRTKKKMKQNKTQKTIWLVGWHSCLKKANEIEMKQN